MYVYVYENYNGNRGETANTEKLISVAVKQYFKDCGISSSDEKNEMRLCRTSKGKPYFAEGLVQFSVSHSENIWVCIMGPSPVGVDIQKISQRNYESIAQRFFQLDEQKSVANGGLRSFIEIWCRKEAFVKYFGLTIGEVIDWLNVASHSIVQNQIEHENHKILFQEVLIDPDFICIAAINQKEKIWIRKIQIE
jgi:4'-phosphopantetheinyl transferase